MGALGAPWGPTWVPLGLHWGLQGHPWGPKGCHLGAQGVPLWLSGALLGHPWDPLGLPWVSLNQKQGYQILVPWLHLGFKPLVLAPAFPSWPLNLKFGFGFGA